MNTQMKIALKPQSVPELKEVPEWMVATCKTLRHAFALCMRESIVKRTDQEWARIFGKTPAEFSLIVYGDREAEPPKGKTKKIRWLPDEWVERVEDLAGNTAITQWMAMRKNRRVISESERERKKRWHREQLAALEREPDDIQGAA